MTERLNLLPKILVKFRCTFVYKTKAIVCTDDNYYLLFAM